ncbi:uncharacterized protein V1516DRAFT_221478 [Lipomyces oligophaga]|uniref:uncharacterized protein n=1 Tax=Lipomyces oligophaga TaxID=45792 RepID=UPI0034CF360D
MKFISNDVSAGLLLVFILVVQLASLASAEKDPKGVKSEVFDHKYVPIEGSLMTPIGQPSLFSFSGRWHRFRDVFKASLWPGTYVTLLSFGDHCTLVLRPRILEPRTLLYQVSVDGGEFFEVSKDITPEETHLGPILIRIDTPGGEKDGREPHVVTVVSSRHTASLSLLGFMIPTTLVNQNNDWLSARLGLPYVEFIGGRDLADRFAISSSEWRAAEEIGARHSHIAAKYPLTLSKEAAPRVKSLFTEYQFLNPTDHDPYQVNHLPHSARYSFNSQHIIEPVTPSVVILNIGEYDVDARVPAEEFADSLYKFIRRLRLNDRPGARLVVVARKGRYEAETRAVVAHLRENEGDSQIIIASYPGGSIGNGDGSTDATVEQWKQFLIRFAVQTPPDVYSLSGIRDATGDALSDLTDQYREKLVSAQASLNSLFIVFAIVVVMLVLLSLRFVVRAVSRAIFSRCCGRRALGRPTSQRYKGVAAKNGVIWD